MKLTKGNTTHWYHVHSPEVDRIRLRQIPHAALGTVADLSPEQFAKEYNLEEQLSLREVAELTGLSVARYSVEEPGAWIHVADRLDRRDIKPAKTLVPVTKLRSFYNWLREAPKHVHAAVARGFADCPEALVELCELSQKHFVSYKTPSNFEVGPRRDADVDEKKEIGRTRSFVSRLEKRRTNKIVVDTGRFKFNLDCWYVEREIDPRTTQQGVLESGEPATSSGTGGIDLLLAHADDKIPIVGEVKIGTDTNPFFGLVQALMYAVELCTPNQYARLRDSFECFQDLAGKPRVDVYLVLHRYPDSPMHKRFLCDTDRLIRGMYEKKSIRSIIRRIVCLVASADPSTGVKLAFRSGAGEGLGPFPPAKPS